MLDPISLGLLMAIGAGGAAAVARWRRKRERPSAAPAKATEAAQRTGPQVSREAGAYRVGEVLLFMGEEYWLAGELALVREGTPALTLFVAPERAQDRWLAAPRQGDVLYALVTDAPLADLGWPGVEVPSAGGTMRRVEEGACTIIPSGEVPEGWSGAGRYAVFRAMETVAVVVEQGSNRLALKGKTVPRRMVERMG
ncbi:MAG: hypothetical protein IPF99_08005 [Deltaproteobacteria bacterium]|nr:hypothetical protein [Deltaproteobacteria bacterium]MBP6832329.1 hypothetical protein [Deltaproteobacteria bacterium]